MMKKFILLCFASALTVSVALAQSTSGSAVLKSSVDHAATDTVVNAATVYQAGAVSFANNHVAVQTTLTKISGTAAGVVRLYGSLDGTNYVRIAPTDSLIVSNVASQSKIFQVPSGGYSYVRAGYTGTGTMSVKMNSMVAARKE